MRAKSRERAGFTSSLTVCLVHSSSRHEIVIINLLLILHPNRKSTSSIFLPFDPNPHVSPNCISQHYGLRASARPCCTPLSPPGRCRTRGCLWDRRSKCEGRLYGVQSYRRWRRRRQLLVGVHHRRDPVIIDHRRDWCAPNPLRTLCPGPARIAAGTLVEGRAMTFLVPT